ncbi:hypothetical protein SLEP1_g3444 [Rubroshorea leprosula]|uniref:Citrate transporter-like domain-containing protein n=1 Tax=Rubroshorea leprosula TaxID=152421 RepID=A0AAV5HKE7_9ROSI|nr:hypothetical protein SLEP1_g3444 [Rubroshorea leprosula]
MAMASVIKLILGSIALVIFWMLAVCPAVPFLPIGRTAGSLFGAVLMVVFQVITGDEAYDATDLSILGLPFGTMVNNLPPHPFLLALALSANIGSAATPIGNAQNLKNEEHSSEDFVAKESVNSHQFSPATMSHLASTYSPGQTSRYASESEIHLTAITAALALMVLDSRMPCHALKRIFFTIEVFNRTGILNTLWELVEPYARIDEAIGVAIRGFIIRVLSNVISNVPMTHLMGKENLGWVVMRQRKMVHG